MNALLYSHNQTKKEFEKKYQKLKIRFLNPKKNSSSGYAQPDTRYQQSYTQDYNSQQYASTTDYSQAPPDYSQQAAQYDTRSYGYGEYRY